MLGTSVLMELQMAPTYEKITREIEALKKKAEKARKQEAAEMVALIKSGIALYGLTAQDLGFTSSAKAKVRPRKPQLLFAGSADADSGAASSSKYSDDAGHSWSGRGPRPAWVKAAIDAGHTLDDLLANRKQKTVGKRAAKPAEKVSSRSSRASNPVNALKLDGPKSKAKYQDGSGNTWSGRGPKPGWLRAAIETGKALEDFLV